MKNKKTLGLQEKYETNPFIFELKNKMYLQPKANTVVAKGQEIIDTATGEIIQESVLIGKRRIVDKSQFAKIYASEISILFELSKTAKNVFLYLSKIMDYENKAYFSYVKDLNKIGYKSKGTVYKALIELLKAKIIAPSTMTNIYWLNPSIICKGERFAIYTEFVTKDYAKQQQEAMLEIQGAETIKKLDGETQEKYRKASNQKEAYQTNIFGGAEKVNINTREIIKPKSKKNNIK